MWGVYIVECSDGTLYTGATNGLERRLKAHNACKGAKYTQTRTPVVLRCWVGGMTKSEALSLEWKIKQQPRRDKIEFLKKQSKTFMMSRDNHYECV